MRVLIIGGGGREHALAWKISRSSVVKKIFCAPGNAGTAALGENVPIPATELDRLVELALENHINLTVVGPEQPLVLGIVDRFRKNGLRAFGPDAPAAKIEASKAFSKDLMAKYNIPTAEYRVFHSADEAKKYIRGKGPLVVKADGLAAGKGVMLCKEENQAAQAIANIMEQKRFGDAGHQVVIEEFLEGPEISLLAFTDGETVLPLDSAQDHKAAYDGDHGPNTGGMGAYSPAPLLSQSLSNQVMKEIMYPTVRAMAQENAPYKGILYAGLMITDSGPKVLEFNARFGDPETQPLLMRMQSDIVPLMEACIDGALAGHKIEWENQAAVCVVMAAAGYPGSYEKGKPISGLEVAADLKDVTVFHAGTKMQEGKVLTNGGRVLGVTALGEAIPSAIKNAYAAVEKIHWDGIHFRKDIGRQALE